MSFHNHKIIKRAKPPAKFSFSEMERRLREAVKRRGLVHRPDYIEKRLPISDHLSWRIQTKRK